MNRLPHAGPQINSSAPVRLRLLGAPSVTRDDTQLHLGNNRALALLAYLSLQRSAVTRETLTALLWPEAAPARARAGLRNALWIVRSQVAGDVVTCSRALVTFADNQSVAVDARQFDALISVARGHDHVGCILCSTCLAALIEAVLLHNAEFLRGFTLPDAPEFDVWQACERSRLQRDFHWALDQLAAHHAARGEWDVALSYAWRRVAEDRLDERAHGALIEIMARAGRRVDALRQYEQCVHLLQGELGVTPQPDLEELVTAIRLGDIGPIDTLTSTPVDKRPRQFAGPPQRRQSGHAFTMARIHEGEPPTWPMLYYE